MAVTIMQNKKKGNVIFCKHHATIFNIFFYMKIYSRKQIYKKLSN